MQLKPLRMQRNTQRNMAAKAKAAKANEWNTQDEEIPWQVQRNNDKRARRMKNWEDKQGAQTSEWNKLEEDSGAIHPFTAAKNVSEWLILRDQAHGLKGTLGHVLDWDMYAPVGDTPKKGYNLLAFAYCTNKQCIGLELFVFQPYRCAIWSLLLYRLSKLFILT